MNKATVMVTFFLTCTAVGFAQAPQTFDAWSVFTSTGRNGEATTLLQTSSFDQVHDAQGQPVVLKLDAICSKGKLHHVALQTTVPVATRAMNFSGPAATTPVSFKADEGSPEVQSWAVLDDRRTLSPYSEIRQAKKNRVFMEHLAHTNTVVLSFQAESQGAPVQASFHTAGISQAFAAVKCAY